MKIGRNMCMKINFQPGQKLQKVPKIAFTHIFGFHGKINTDSFLCFLLRYRMFLSINMALRYKILGQNCIPCFFSDPGGAYFQVVNDPLWVSMAWFFNFRAINTWNAYVTLPFGLRIPDFESNRYTKHVCDTAFLPSNTWLNSKKYVTWPAK